MPKTKHQLAPNTTMCLLSHEYSYPKRTDIWNVFVDKEIKFKNFDEARRLFCRMVTLKISSKTIKSIFKKFLNFEISHGTLDQQEAVKEKAREYVNSLL